MLGKNKQIDEDIDAAMQRARENAKGSKGDDAQNAEDARGGSNDNAAKLEAEIATLTNDLQRTRADFENYRKQMDAQKENEKKATRLATIYKILGLLDDLDRAFEAYNAELAPLKKSLEKTLKELGLTKIPTDGAFNPDLHEAVMVEGDGEVEMVAEVLRPGYYYENEVLRPAMVKVVKK